jgi:hypothetical protein
MQRQAAILAFFALTLVPFFDATGQALSTPVAPITTKLKMADSLFTARQYTQAFEQYSALRQSGRWSPAMFLKMAYIQEGLGHLAESLYYLNLYSLTAHDEQAAAKMAELAEKNRLEGYQDDPWEVFRAPLRDYFVSIAGVLSVLCLLFLALQVDRFRRQKAPSPAGTIILVLLLAGLFAHVQYSRRSDTAIVTRGNTYLMSAPSAGGAVVDIIGEGHRVRIKGRSDVWLQVEWKEKEAYIRDFLVKPIRL